MEGAPEHEGPGRPVPQPAEQHREQEVHVGARLPPAVSAERDVEVVAQPGREADVPALPELPRVRARSTAGRSSARARSPGSERVPRAMSV